MDLRASGLLLAVVLLASAAEAQLPTEPTTYELRDTSSYTEGCFDPCACPIWMVGPVSGTLVLRPAGMQGNVHQFTVESVDWSFTRAGEPVTVSGSGTWDLDPVAQAQRLELDLQIGTDPVAHFDSGPAEILAKLPDLRAAVAMNGFFCYDYAFEVVAAPAAGIEGAAISWGMQKARY